LFFFKFGKKKKTVGHVAYWHVAHIWTCVQVPNGHTHWNKWPHGRVKIIHAAMWARVINTLVRTATCINPRGHMATCINPRGRSETCNKYTCPNVFQLHPATLSIRHVAIWPRGYSNRYCSHVANSNFFCGACWVAQYPFGPWLPSLWSYKIIVHDVCASPNMTKINCMD